MFFFKPVERKLTRDFLEKPAESKAEENVYIDVCLLNLSYMW